MHLFKLLAELAVTDPAHLAQTAPRRAALNALSRFGAQTLAAALPLGLAALPAHAGTATVLDSLSLALQLEYLQEAFYTQALAVVGFVPSTDNIRASVSEMLRHQQQHVRLLTEAITSSGGTAPARPNFDFTGSRNGTRPALFAAVFSNVDEFLRLAQLLEDAGVRTYKGQAEVLRTNAYILQTALQLHATEARHATRIRLIRQKRGAVVKPWPSPADASIVAAGTTDAVYAGENALEQLSPAYRPVPFRLLPIGFPGTNILTQGVPEAFDEPMNTAQATAFMTLFAY